MNQEEKDGAAVGMAILMIFTTFFVVATLCAVSFVLGRAAAPQPATALNTCELHFVGAAYDAEQFRNQLVRVGYNLAPESFELPAEWPNIPQITSTDAESGESMHFQIPQVKTWNCPMSDFFPGHWKPANVTTTAESKPFSDCSQIK